MSKSKNEISDIAVDALVGAGLTAVVAGFWIAAGFGPALMLTGGILLVIAFLVS